MPCLVIEFEESWNGDKSIATLAPRYEYSVNGRTFTGTRYDFSNHRFDVEETHGLRKRYPPESATTCFVDVDAPEKSVLTQAYNSSYTGGCTIGGVLTALGALLTCLGVFGRIRNLSAGESLMSPGD